MGKKGWRAEKCVCVCDVAINTSRDIFFRTVMGVACGHVCQKIKDGDGDGVREGLEGGYPRIWIWVNR